MQINRIILDYSVKTMDESQKGSFWLKMTEWPVSRFVLSCMWSQIRAWGECGPIAQSIESERLVRLEENRWK